MVKIRLALNKGAASYSIVAIDSRTKRDGKFIQKLGFYNPKLKDENSQRLFIDLEEAAKFIGFGAQPTERAARLINQCAQKTGYAFPQAIQSKLNEIASFHVSSQKAAE